MGDTNCTNFHQFPHSLGQRGIRVKFVQFVSNFFSMEITIVLATVVALAMLARRQPAQNVFAITVLAIVISSAIELFALRTAIPFNSILSRNMPSEKILAGLDWPIPLLWLA